MTKPHTISQAKSDSKNAKRYSLKLNKVTDADLIDAIDNMIDERGEPLQKQTAVKNCYARRCTEIRKIGQDKPFGAFFFGHTFDTLLCVLLMFFHCFSFGRRWSDLAPMRLNSCKNL